MMLIGGPSSAFFGGAELDDQILLLALQARHLLVQPAGQ